jgi:UDPglucose 6-dehydrogenase
MREAASVALARMLLAQGASVRAYDPVAVPVAQTILPEVEYCTDAYEVAQDADAVLLVTEWNEFKQLDMKRVKDSMRTPFLIDGRNLYDGAALRELGFTYRGIGRN